MVEDETSGQDASEVLLNEADDEDLSSVDAAIEAVQNETEPVEEPTVVKATPSNVIPEIEDIEDTDEMVQILLNVGEERSRRDEIKGALAAFNKAIALDPSSDMAWFNRGVLLEAQQDARGARQSFQICLDLNENHAPATANMAILLERIGDLEGAYDMAEKALAFFPGHPALVDLKVRCKNSGLSVPMEAMQPSIEVVQEVDMQVVTEVAEAAGIENPEDLLQEAVHHDHDDDDSLTVEELQSAAEVVVAQQEVMKEVVAVQEPEPEQVVEIPEPEVVEVAEPDIESLVEQATQLLKDGEPKQALSMLKPHLKTIGATNSGAWRIAGGAMARLELDNHAIAAMTHAQNLEPSHAPGWFNLGSIQQRNSMMKEAMNSYQKSLEADASYLKSAEKLNALSREHGFIESFLASSRQLLQIDGDHVIKGEFIDMLLQLAQGESQVLDQVSGLPPTLPAGPEMAKEALTHLGEESSPRKGLALSLSLQHGDAVLVWKALIQTDGQNAEYWQGLARALEQAGDLETAQKCHAKARTLSGNVEPEPALAVEPAPIQEVQEAVAEVPQQDYNSLLAPATAEPAQDEGVMEAPATPESDLLMTPLEPKPVAAIPVQNVEVDLAKAALDAAQTVARTTPQSTQSNAISNQDVAWFNQGVQLIDDKKYKEALSCFDKALPAFAGDDDMIIRILNNRGNAYYFLEEYPKCVEAYHQAMLIKPTEVRGETLYNMGTAYAEMERYNDAIKCFEQAMPRGLDGDAQKRAKDQIRRCRILQKAIEKKRKRK
ncbi:MAG: tetratricopeptide repeat protein [Candidatus Poseidonia sp.]|nr:tetratricopeptide repeat protein [Poseidonia sp.]